MGRYSYSQPSEDEPLFGNNDDSDYSETEDLIRRDQAELSLERCSQVHYPPQPEVEFGFPQVCYCGAHPVLATSNSRNDQGMYYGSWFPAGLLLWCSPCEEGLIIEFLRMLNREKILHLRK